MQIEGRKKEGNVSTEGESKNYVKRKGSGKERKRERKKERREKGQSREKKIKESA